MASFPSRPSLTAMLVTPTMGFTSGMTVGSQPPLWRIRAATRVARTVGMDVAWVTDHFLGFFPQALWDKDFSWLADQKATTPSAFSALLIRSSPLRP